MPSEDPKPEPESQSRKRVLRPDEMSGDICDFLAAIDRYKRDNLRKFLELDEILEIFVGLGYASRDDEQQGVEAFAEALDGYKQEKGRLFPNWSEIFEVLTGLGYDRVDS